MNHVGIHLYLHLHTKINVVFFGFREFPETRCTCKNTCNVLGGRRNEGLEHRIDKSKLYIR